MTESLYLLLYDYGYAGMLVAAFLAGSFFPFSSEAIMLALLAAGLNPIGLLVWGTIGNSLGGMFNYSLGRLGKTEWITNWLKVDEAKLSKAMSIVANKGAWAGLLSPLPILGSVVTISLGLLRANPLIVALSVSLSKFIRYAILVYSAMLII